AKAAGKLGKGTVARVAREWASRAGASPTITIRLAEDDLTRARTFAAEKGLRYQTYLKMLLHEALNSEEKRWAAGSHRWVSVLTISKRLSASPSQPYHRAVNAV